MRAKQLRPILIIGRIGRAHALFGEFRVNPLTDDINRFIGLRNCLLLSPDEQRYQTVQVLSSRIVTNQVYVRLKGFESRELAESLRGRLLAVHREQAVKLPPDTWFICDLIGCDVFDASRGYLGILTEVVQNLAQDVYTITLEGQADLLLPAKKEFIQKLIWNPDRSMSTCRMACMKSIVEGAAGMRFSVLTLFPEIIRQNIDSSITGRAWENGLFDLETIQIRDFAVNRYGKVDDYCFGGGTGMLMMAEPIYQAWQTAVNGSDECRRRTIFLSPRGTFSIRQRSPNLWNMII